MQTHAYIHKNIDTCITYIHLSILSIHLFTSFSVSILSIQSILSILSILYTPSIRLYSSLFYLSTYLFKSKIQQSSRASASPLFPPYTSICGENSTSLSIPSFPSILSIPSLLSLLSVLSVLSVPLLSITAA